MRTLIWWSWETVAGACIGGALMALVCPLMVWTMDTFPEVKQGKPPPVSWDWEGAGLVGLVTGAIGGAFLGAQRAYKRRLHQRGTTALPDLISNLLESENELERLTAAEVLAELGPAAKAAIPALRIAQQDANEQVREAAAHAMARIEK